MSFTKAKLTRFNDVPIGSGADNLYDPKDDAKFPGGIIDKFPRFSDKEGGTPIKSSSKSETGSVRSCKSAQLFRTPSIRRQLKKFTLNRIKPKESTPTPSTSTLDEDTKELLWANRIEIQNKDETIAENEKLLEEQKETILLLKKQIDSLKQEQEFLSCDLKNMTELSELEREEYKILYDKFSNLLGSNHHDDTISLYHNFRKLHEDFENYLKSLQDSIKKEVQQGKEAFDRVNQEKSSLEKLLEELQFELLAQKKKHDEENRENTLKIEYLKEKQEMKIRELESCREVEKKQIISEYSDKLKELEQDLRNELELVQQTAVEKVQLAELTADEKCKVLEMVMKDEFEKEKLSWQSEFEKCQKIAETEIMQSEFEKLDLQSMLNTIKDELNNEKKKQQILEKNVTDKCCEIALLFSRFNSLKEEFNQHKAKCEQELKQARDDLSKKCNDLYKYELTVNTMRNTINILSTRLQKSDADVEDLKEQNTGLSKSNIDLEKANIHYRAELALLQSKLIEYQVTLSNITSSSRSLLENSDVLAQRQEFLKIIDHLQNDTEGKICSMNNDFIKKIDVLKEKCSNELNVLVNENRSYKNKLQDTQKQLDDIYSTLKIIDEVLCNIETASRDKENKLQEKDEKILLLSNEIKEMKSLFDENEYLKNDIESYDLVLKGKDVIISNLECELNNVKYDFQEYRENVNEKLQEFEEIESSSARRESELQSKVEEQRLRIIDLEAQVEEAMTLIGPFREQLKNYESERLAFENRTEQVTGDAREIALKYAELLGHQNHKQKLKYFVKVKKQNLDLTEENFQLQLQVNRLKSEVEKLQKVKTNTLSTTSSNSSRDHSPVNPMKISWKHTPTPSRKDKKKTIPKTPSEDIENLGSPKFNKDLIKHNRVVLGESPVRNDSNKRVASLE